MGVTVSCKGPSDSNPQIKSTHDSETCFSVFSMLFTFRINDYFKRKRQLCFSNFTEVKSQGISSARGSANHWRKNVLLRSALLPIQLPISPNWEFRAHSTSVRTVISDSCPPSSVYQDNIPLHTRSRPSSLPSPTCQLSLASALFS